MVVSQVSQKINVRSLAAVGLIMSGGLLFMMAFVPTVNQVPDQVTCDPVEALESVPTTNQINSAARTTKRSAQNFRLTKTIVTQAALKQSGEFRKRRLLSLFENDTHQARRLLLREPELEKIESVTNNCVEKKVTIAGQLNLLHGEDFASHKEYTQYSVNSGSQEYALYGLEDVAEIEPGAKVQITGFNIDGNILVATPTQTDPQPTVQTTSEISPALLSIPTPRKLLALLGDFNNTNLRTPDYATIQTVYPKISEYFEENSHQLVTINTTSFDYFEMNLARGSICDAYGVARELIRLADPQVDFTQFNYADLAIIAPFPLFPSETNHSSCRWDGMSSVTPQSFMTAEGNVRLTVVWIKTPITTNNLEGVLDHELGHNIASYGHANHTWCVAGQTFYGPNCELRDAQNNIIRGNFEYGDPFDVMGGWYYPTYSGYGIGHFNAARKAYSGWLPLNEIVTINSGDAPQTVTLVPLERSDPGNKLIKIQRNSYEYMTVQYRQPLMADGTPNFDNVFSSSFPAIFEGATIHTSSGSATYLLDTTPTPDNDPADVVVRVGETFSDPSTGAAIHVDAKTADGLTVTITPPTIDFWPPPAPVVVNDGPGVDIDTTNETSSIAANWEAVTDIGFGLDHYEYTVVWPSGELIPPTSSGLNTFISLSGLNLQPGITYTVGVQAIDKYGNAGNYRFSDGLTINIIRPPNIILSTGSQPAAPDCVLDGLSWDDSVYTNQADVLSAIWCESIDLVDYYQYAIGSTSGGTDIVPYTRAPETFWFSHPRLQLVDGQILFISVRGVGSNSVAGPKTTSNGITVDLSSPVAPSYLNDGLGIDEDITASQSTLTGNWAPISDPGPVQYHVGIGTAPGLVNVHSYNLQYLTNSSFTNVAIDDGQTYFITLRAVDIAGNLSPIISSDGIVVDINSDPIPPTVSMLVPINGSTVSGTVFLSAIAIDNRQILGVKFYLDGQLFGNEDLQAPYMVAWDTTVGPPTAHTIYAVARDGQNQATSATVTVTVNNPVGQDTEAPNVYLFSPSDQSTVSGLTTIWSMVDDNIGVTHLQYYLNDQPIGPSITQWPYRWDWDSTGVYDGTHTITGKAYDQAGNQGISGPVTIVVQNGRLLDYISPSQVQDLRY